MKSKIKKVTYQNPIVIMNVLFIIGIYGLGIPMGHGLWGMIAQRLILGSMMFVALYLIAGKEAFQWTKKSGRYVFFRGAYPLLVSFYFSVSSLIGGPWIIKNNIVLVFIIYLLFSFSIGLFEEGLFRGIIMNGFVKIMPKTKAGLYWAVITSSFIFGFVHVMSYIPYIGINPLSIIVQMISKIINAGALSIPDIIIAVMILKKLKPQECIIWK